MKTNFILCTGILLIFNFNVKARTKLSNQPRLKIAGITAGKRKVSPFTAPELNYTENHIHFRLNTSEYPDSNSLYLRYALISETDSTWINGEPGEKKLDFVSLSPGKYSFVAFAVHPIIGKSRQPVIFDFVIQPPFWHRFWFKALVFLVIFFLVLYILMSYTINKRAMKAMFDLQYQSIRLERQRISSEIHDDIGSALFAIQLFTDMANKRGENADLSHISKLLVDISEKIREVIWSTNIENDNLENLIYYIQYTTERLFDHSDIEFTSTIPDEIEEVNIDSFRRRNISLIVKELAHNALKHSFATNISLKISVEDDLLVVVLRDNGIGFDSTNVNNEGMGLENIRLRVITMKGSFTIENYKGTVAIVRIPIVDTKVAELRYMKNFWKLFTFDLFRKS